MNIMLCKFNLRQFSLERGNDTLIFHLQSTVSNRPKSRQNTLISNRLWMLVIVAVRGVLTTNCCWNWNLSKAV